MLDEEDDEDDVDELVASLPLSEDEEDTEPASLELEEVLDVANAILLWRMEVGGRA